MTKRSILLLAFLEGGLVMLLELSVPHALAPIIGNSIDTWSKLILLSVGGLAIGYFIGSQLSRKLKLKAILFTLLYSSLILGMLSFLSYYFLNINGIFLNEVFSAYLLAIISLFLPSILLSSTTPILIKLFSQYTISPGYIFSISTFGGVLFTFITGFIILPDFGIMRSFELFLILNFFMVLLCGWTISKLKRNLISFTLLVGIIILFIPLERTANEKYSILEMREGLDGQLLVLDESINENVIQRTLFINRMGQTMIRITNGNSISSVWSYAGIIKSLASYHEKSPSKALVLGLGGGIVPLFLSDKNELNYSIDAVELNKNIIEISQNHFYLPADVTVFEEDARRFLNANNTKYDFIVMDVFNGEITPSHVLSVEAFEKVKKSLSKRGFVVINFNGNITGELGIGGRSLYKTLIKSGFKVSILPSFEVGERNRNNLFIASLFPIDLSKINIPMTKNNVNSTYNVVENSLDLKKINFNDAFIITDDFPVMEKLNQAAAKQWRDDYLKYSTIKYRSMGIPLFK